MSTTLPLAPPAGDRPAVTPPDEAWRLSVAQYHAMIGAGILTEDDPVELLEGWLVTKTPKKPRHRVVTQLLQSSLVAHSK